MGDYRIRKSAFTINLSRLSGVGSDGSALIGGKQIQEGATSLIIGGALCPLMNHLGGAQGHCAGLEYAIDGYLSSFDVLRGRCIEANVSVKSVSEGNQGDKRDVDLEPATGEDKA